MYRTDSSAKLEFEAEVYEVPCPRREGGAAWRLALLIVLVGAVVCGGAHYLRARHTIGLRADPFDWVVTAAAALLPVLLAPILPLHHVVRLLFAAGRRRVVSVAITGSNVKWAGSWIDRNDNLEVDCCLGVRVGKKPQVLLSSSARDAPVLLRVSDESMARRLIGTLGVAKSGHEEFAFPVWIVGNPRPRYKLRRASLVLFLAGIAIVEGIAISMGPWTSFGILLFVAPLCVPVALYLLMISWTSLEELPVSTATVNTSAIKLDGEVLCSLKDRLTLTITEDACLEIAAIQIPEAKRLIKPWRAGDVHELELIKATIEAFQARTTGDAAGAISPSESM